MARDREDEVFLEVMVQSLKRINEGDFSQDTQRWSQEARALIESAREGLLHLVQREDLEEEEASEALASMQHHRQQLDEAFSRQLAALDIRLGEIRIAQDASARDDYFVGLAQFLNRYHDGGFESLRTQAAISQARRAHDYALHYGAHEETMHQLRDALSGLEQALSTTRKEGAEAVEAYGELVEGRSMARVCYLTARDLMSATLRFEGCHDKLDWFIPSLADVLKVGV